MTSDESIMSEMIDRAVSRENVDELGVQMFCLVVRSNPNMISKAKEMLINKIRSSDVTESTRAVSLLEECMSKCGTEFQDEVAKFKFLNELIRLVSKKYQGESTPTAIKQRIMECLLLWTTEFPQKSKIREAYDMLNKEGSVEHGTSSASVAKRESVLGIDEEMLSKLIKSGDPENFKRANLLIQYRVNQEARHTELISQHKSELNEVQNTANLLAQMLDTYEKENNLDVDGSDTMNLIRELYMACKKHKQILQRLPELIQSTDESLIADTLETNDILQGVMKRYNDVIVHPPTKINQKKNPTQTDLLSELLGDVESSAPEETVLSIPNKEPIKTTTNSKDNTLEELREIFGKLDNPVGNLSTEEILQPVNVFSESKENNSVIIDTPERTAFRELREIDKLSDELFKQSNIQSSERIKSFKRREPEKRSLNDLLREKQSEKSESSSILTPIFDKNEVGKNNNETYKEKEISLALVPEDDEILSSNTETKLEVNHNSPEVINKGENTIKIAPQEKNEKPQVHLSDIEVDLDELTPCGSERVLLDDEDVKITMNFTEDRPSKYVSVIVIAMSNKSKQSLKNFQFEASVKKPCKVRLLKPTENTLPPYKPYRPPTPINQVMLLLNPTGKDVDVTCIFGYTLGDDPDPIKESIVVKGVSYVE